MWIAQATDVDGAAAGIVIIFLLIAGLYFVPTIVAMVRQVSNLGSVIVINLFLGWTLIGWVIALAMAARSKPPGAGTVIVNTGGGSQPPPVP